MFDFIGDVHGHSVKLKMLLTKLGYVVKNGVYEHPEKRIAFFLGDIIDSGPNVKETVDIVKGMVKAGSARMILGNHEFNMIAYFTKTKEDKSEYCRSHNENHNKQIEKSIDYFNSEEGQETINWFKTLPLFCEEENFRAVHACWDQKSINVLNNFLSGNIIDESFIQLARKGKDHQLYQAMENVLKGIEEPLPNGESFVDNYGKKRYRQRIEWWNSEFYSKEDKSVFFGHYWRKDINGAPFLTSSNAVCLDFSVAKGGLLCAYRFKHNERISSGNLIYV